MLSRVADNLYWMSRYLERAEHTARLIDVSLNLMLDQAPAAAEQHWRRLLRLLAPSPQDAVAVDDAYSITQWLTFDPSNHTSIVACVVAARENARQVRELISSEMWEQLNQLFLQVNRTKLDDIWNAQPHEFFRTVKQGAHLFQGITDATMNHGEGWYFIQLGCSIERAAATAALLDSHFREFPYNQAAGVEISNYLEWVGLLRSCTAFEAYCKVYTANVRAAAIVEFLLLNPESPRSVRFAAERIERALKVIAQATGPRSNGRAERLAGRLRSTLDYAQIDEIMADNLHAYLEQIQRQCGQVHAAIQETYITYPIESALVA